MPKDTQSTPQGDNSGVDPELNINYEDFKAILDGLTDKGTAISEATGALRASIKSTLDQYGWHKGALAMIRQIEDMSQTKRADFLRTFEAMFDLMVTKKWRDEMHDLIPSDGPIED